MGGCRMSKLKDKIFKPDNEKTFTLTEYEHKYLQDMQNVLLFHTLRSNLISGFLTYIATTRLGYTELREGYALQYELDIKSEDRMLTVKEVPKDEVVEN
jgi:hypothetical protein